LCIFSAGDDAILPSGGQLNPSKAVARIHPDIRRISLRWNDTTTFMTRYRWLIQIVLDRGK
jgi:hypothetical protein